MTEPVRKSPEQSAEEHWSWLETVLHKMYVDAFVHGYKHGTEAVDETKNDEKQ